MSRNADVTVVIPCFNHGEYLGEAIASALGQEGGAPSVVVVDDGSTDGGTRRALGECERDARVVSRPRGGPAAARNTGARHATTPYLLMLDADDRLAPGALAALRAALDAEPQLGFAYGVTEFFGDWSGRLALPPFDPYRLLYRSLVPATSLIRRDVFEAVGGFDPGVPGYEDWDFYLGAVERGWRGRQVDAPMLLYRQHGQSQIGADRRSYRRAYRALRRKHRALYRRAGELAAGADAGLLARLLYPTYFAWRPVPAAVERRLYGLLFRARRGQDRAASASAARQ